MARSTVPIETSSACAISLIPTALCMLLTSFIVVPADILPLTYTKNGADPFYTAAFLRVRVGRRLARRGERTQSRYEDRIAPDRGRSEESCRIPCESSTG